MDTKNPLEVYEKFLKSMPSIGFVNRNKRIKAYIKVTNLAQKMIDNQEISEDEALFVLSIMAKKSNPLSKAIGFKYADEMRCTLNLPSAIDEINNN